ncbi:hypothetical protein BgiMline_007285, partial [Biomphalaria glabrata]
MLYCSLITGTINVFCFPRPEETDVTACGPLHSAQGLKKNIVKPDEKRRGWGG